MNWNQRYKEMKKGLGITNKDVAEITGNTEDSIKTATSPSYIAGFPRWAKLAIHVYETLTRKYRIHEKIKTDQERDQKTKTNFTF